MERYLVEAKYGDELYVRFFEGVEELTGWLSGEFEQAQYGDASYTSIDVYRHAEGGKLEKLTVTCKGSSGFDEDDYADIGYELSDATGAKATFSIRIDGRA
jgi:hypothetical protein